MTAAVSGGAQMTCHAEAAVAITDSYYLSDSAAPGSVPNAESVRTRPSSTSRTAIVQIVQFCLVLA